MKKFISFLTLLSFLIIGFIHNSVIIFASNISKQRVFNSESVACCSFQSKTTWWAECVKNCCLEQWIDHWIGSSGNRVIKKKWKMLLVPFVMDYSSVSLFSFSHKNLVKTTSPPQKKYKSENYAYYTLIWIVQSTT
jgi:hypothetical protein